MIVGADRYWIMVSAVNQTMAVLDENEGHRVAAALADLDVSQPPVPFVRFCSIDGETMAVNPMFVGYLKKVTPESKQYSEEWNAAHTKKEWEK